MKRSIIALIMALAMILTLVACGNSNGDNNNGGNDVTLPRHRRSLQPSTGGLARWH